MAGRSLTELETAVLKVLWNERVKPNMGGRTPGYLTREEIFDRLRLKSPARGFRGTLVGSSNTLKRPLRNLLDSSPQLLRAIIVPRGRGAAPIAYSIDDDNTVTLPRTAALLTKIYSERMRSDEDSVIQEMTAPSRRKKTAFSKDRVKEDIEWCLNHQYLRRVGASSLAIGDRAIYEYGFLKFLAEQLANSDHTAK